MKWNLSTCGLALATCLLFAACEDDPAPRRVEFQVDGSVDRAALVWRDGRGLHQELQAELPWIHAFNAAEGTRVSVTVSSGNTAARLWIRVLEDGAEVRVVPGCLCNGSSVGVQADGVVGDWGR
ncbi:MAG: hypothetical protein Q8O14_04870 [bacterium]|jgi:hypothetical protein|nr:hypothetical protein [bacterium]